MFGKCLMDSNLKNIPIKVLIFMLSPIYSTGSVVIVEEDMNCIYRDPNEPVEARIRDLLSRMTLKEKVGQMTQIERRVATPDAIKDLSIAICSRVGVNNRQSTRRRWKYH
ncbi:hypothetical protein CFP56_011579 [Quercus suber]|uniref:Uncharacterized protein n=1 Tax=Quercus suber TaxID=58331 RepID=A0AAW0KYX4_QUESU